MRVQEGKGGEEEREGRTRTAAEGSVVAVDATRNHDRLDGGKQFMLSFAQYSFLSELKTAGES